MLAPSLLQEAVAVQELESMFRKSTLSHVGPLSLLAQQCKHVVCVRVISFQAGDAFDTQAEILPHVKSDSEYPIRSIPEESRVKCDAEWYLPAPRTDY